MARIGIVGAGWWTQGWHLPHLNRNEGAVIAGICDRQDQPRSTLNPHLESLEDLSQRYGGVPCFRSVDDMLKALPDLDGIIVATDHQSHFEIGKRLLNEAMKRIPVPSSGDENENENEKEHENAETTPDKAKTTKPLHIFMEKPLTTNVHEANELCHVSIRP